MKITKKILISALAISPLTTLTFIPSVVRPNEVKTYSSTIYDDYYFYPRGKEINLKDYADVFELLIKEFDYEPQNSNWKSYDLIKPIPKFIKHRKDTLNKKIIKFKELSADMLKYYKEINQDFIDGFRKKDKFDINEYLTNKRVKKYYKYKINDREYDGAYFENADFDAKYELEKRSKFNGFTVVPWKWLNENDFKKQPLVSESLSPVRRSYLLGIDLAEYETREELIKKIIEVNNNYMLDTLKGIRFNIKLVNIYLDYLNNKLKLLEEIENIFLTVMMKDDYKESMKKYYSSEALKTLIRKIKESENKIIAAAKEYISDLKYSNNTEKTLDIYNDNIKRELNKIKELSDHKKILEKHFKLQ